MEAKTLALYLGCNVKNNTSRNWQLIGITSTHEGVQCPLIKDRDQDYVCSVPFGSFKLLLRPLSTLTELEMLDGKRSLSFSKWGPYTADDVKWLLSKGFDLFGLLEKGYALDATKVEKVNEI